MVRPPGEDAGRLIGALLRLEPTMRRLCEDFPQIACSAAPIP
jgi:hypothetical protein